jgi:Xaa-Pro aminopeptidase
MSLQTAWRRASILLALLAVLGGVAGARVREPNQVYAERRARLRAQVDGPIVLFGYTGREDASPSYVLNQEENFYYLTGYNEPGAALVLVPNSTNGKSWNGLHETLFLPSHDSTQERWNGPRMGPTDPGIAEKTGFENVESFGQLPSELEKLTRIFPNLYTLLPRQEELGYPHARNWTTWLYHVVPQSQQRDITARIAAMRQVKSPGELELLTRAIELSMDAQLEAMKMLRPGLYEYQVAARMAYVHSYGGCEREAYAPIVGAGFDSTILHYNTLRKLIRDADIVVLDVSGEYSGYAADLTRTLPANGTFSPRQREIYEIVLGAQNAVLAAVKPGATLGRTGSNSLYRIVYDYLNSHGKDKEGRSLGRYFSHGLGHHVGLLVHDVGDRDRPLEPGMVVTIEPGLYLPEENLGVRIEDEVLITETGYKLLSARLPRTVEEIEKIMAEARKKRE